MVLEARSLRKALLSSSVFQHPSPANLQSTRLALHVNEDGSSCWVYVASGCQVFRLQLPMEASIVSEGKEGLLIPEKIQVTDSSVLNRCPHRAEIQSIVLSETDCSGYLVLGSVDSFGHLLVSKQNISGKDSDTDRLTYSVLPRDSGVGEGSWAGLCFNPSQWSTTAVARSFCKSIDVYDQDIHLRTLRTLWYPSSLNFVKDIHHGGGNSILGVAEGCQLTIWDLRMKENGGCLQRVCGSVGDIFYSVCCSSTGNIAIGGADRTVTVYDPRRWAPISRWVHCSKYEITGLAFSSLEPDYVYVQGVDYEVFCGNWKEYNKAFTFRGDSNWLGFSKCSNRDVVGGWCDSGSIFLANVGTKLNDDSGMLVDIEAKQGDDSS